MTDRLPEPGSGPMPPSRPAPQYGEYASAEEVARIMGTPPPPDPGARVLVPDPVPSARVVDPSAPPARRWDPAITVGLLVLGLWNAIGAIPAFWRFDLALAQSFASMPGTAPDVAPGEPTRFVGQLLLGVWALLFLVALGASVSRLRARRRAFWIPLVAGAASVLAMIVAMTVILIVDPGLAVLLTPPVAEN